MKALVVVGVVVGVVALAVAVDVGLAFVLMAVLHSAGVRWGFWPCFGVVFLLTAIFGGGGRAAHR